MTRSGKVRFALMNGHRQFEPSGPKSARNGNEAAVEADARSAPAMPIMLTNHSASQIKTEQHFGLLKCLSKFRFSRREY